MAQAHKAIRVEHERKMCLSCGYRGRILQGERGLITFQCPSCGCDLYARPPRSYAELEGFIAPDPAANPTRSIPLPDKPAKAERRARHGIVLERLLAWSIAVTLLLAVSGGMLAALL